MPNDTDLIGLIGSRICHDLISPLGAIGNGVELLSTSGISTTPEMALISQSVDNASARLRFFRIAFGAAPANAAIGRNEILSVLRDLYRSNRLRVDWRVAADLTRQEAKLAFLVLQCVENALPWGGQVAVTRTDDVWCVAGRGDRLRVERPLWESLKDGADAPISPSEVQFALVGPLASQMGRRVVANIRESSVTVSF